MAINKCIKDSNTSIKLNVNKNVYQQYITNTINIDNLWHKSNLSNLINGKINNWNGVKSKYLTELMTIRQYFSLSKNRFDNVKVKLFLYYTFISFFFF